jgi:hypothetical protein
MGGYGGGGGYGGMSGGYGSSLGGMGGYGSSMGGYGGGMGGYGSSMGGYGGGGCVFPSIVHAWVHAGSLAAVHRPLSSAMESRESRAEQRIPRATHTSVKREWRGGAGRVGHVVRLVTVSADPDLVAAFVFPLLPQDVWRWWNVRRRWRHVRRRRRHVWWWRNVWRWWNGVSLVRL